MRAPTGKTLVALVVALCFLSGVIGWRFGEGTRASAGDARVEFLHAMIGHHEQAVAMSQIELFEGRERDIQVFAEEILRFQAYELGLMERFLIELGHRRGDVEHRHMPGMATEDEMDRLRAAGDDTDAWFVALMVDHHAAGVAMAETVATDRADDGLGGLAARMAIAQRAEIAELLRAADRLGLDVPPAGVTWDVYEP